ncbi:MAG: LexA family transcriptional regulator [Cyclobacteriaceae bacterium]|nr:LexA family transcriptional regulator [Cyclobacteriaceae bacterium]
MSYVANNLKYLRKLKGLTQEQLAEALNIKRSLVGAYEEGRADPRLSNLTNMAEFFDTTVDYLINQDMSNLSEKQWSQLEKPKGKEILAITVDSTGRENIELVPQKAAAGYMNGYADPEFISELPKFHLPVLPSHGTYRAFEISGDSMLPILPGTIIIGEYVEEFQDIKSGKTYILVTRNDGIVYKRVFNYLNENGKLFLVSDNRQYEPYPIDGEDVVEVWASKAFISIQFPDVENDTGISTEQLAKMVLDLQKEIIRLKEK